MNNFKLALLSSLIITTLTGCELDGDDGAQGPQGASGTDGTNGLDGTNGKNAPIAFNTKLIGRAVLNAQDPEGAAEIVAYQYSKGWVYAINSSMSPATVEVIDINDMDPTALSADSEGIINNTNLSSAITIELNQVTGANLSGDANSIAIDNNNELLAVAVDSGTTGEVGMVAFYDIAGASPVWLKNVTVGFLPDSLAFSPDGNKLVVANEGEPSGDYSIDPEGSISIINIESGVPADTSVNITFTSLNTQQAELQNDGVVFANPNGRTINGNLYTGTVAKDLEPEYVTISKDSKTAYVSIQENNALAIIDLTTNTLKAVKGLGFKDWGQLKLDASDKDGGLNLQSYPGLYGMYQPDTIATYTWNQANFIVSANEGDGREYFFDANSEAECTAAGGLDYDEDDGCLAFIDEIRTEDLTLGANFDYLNNDDNDIGRLKVTTFLGASDNSTDGSGTYSKLYTYGARSFSIWDQNGELVFDSGDQIERITASVHGAAFNNDEDENVGDTRSDAKGPEPEALALGEIDGRTYAFVGLERMGGVMIYDITNPYQAEFVDYFYNRGTVEDAEITGDLAPEGMQFIPAAMSPTETPLLLIGNEISGSVTVWEVMPK
ncbi:choice-of-anchor I family protein [Psychrosphaera ytuae]|uniref:Choice-of-anchor I family protein n=1 Tax=Psychrosphaera ytuae TaxID=2820710 RepID=A0A975HJX6_9GAMM|nr:choice-of-anchor I family protein [Psychrosphaera ytuae]QTH63704.1 choice-of-anchor I family protein [Psychrosphaera ytuae]